MKHSLEQIKFDLGVYCDRLSTIELLIMHKENIPDYVVRLKALIRLLNKSLTDLEKL